MIGYYVAKYGELIWRKKLTIFIILIFGFAIFFGVKSFFGVDLLNMLINHFKDNYGYANSTVST